MTDTGHTQESAGVQESTGVGAPYGSYREITRTAWVGWIMFAGIMMFMLGTFEAIQGFVALFKDEYYLVGRNDLVVSVDYTTWGWVHLLLGIAIAAAGLGVMAGKAWARVVGVLVVMLCAIVNVAFLAAYPVWSTIIITVDVLVIYALTVHGGEAKADYP